MQRKFVFIILLVSFIAILYFSIEKDIKPFVDDTLTEITKVVNNSTLESANSNEVIDESQAASIDQSDFAVKEVKDYSLDEVKNWIVTESKAMDSTKNNTNAKAIDLKEKAGQLNDEQLTYLKDLILDTKLPANNRIFAAYLIGLNQSDVAEELMLEVAKAEVAEDGPLEAHSEAELKHNQELALRYMQVDALFERAKKDSTAFELLRVLSLEAASAQVRGYAEKKLKELEK